MGLYIKNNTQNSALINVQPNITLIVLVHLLEICTGVKINFAINRQHIAKCLICVIIKKILFNLAKYGLGSRLIPFLNAFMFFFFPLSFICKCLIVVSLWMESMEACCPFNVPNIWLHCIHYPSVVPGDEGILNVTFAFADELANQGFTAITNQGRHVFIYLYSSIATINQSVINLPPHQ